MKKLTLTTIFILITALTAAAQVQELEAWWMDMGETDSTGIGTSIAALGDINQDGYDDFLVGSWNEEAFVYFGNSMPDTIPHLIIPKPDTIGYNFGISLYNVGDVNGDGGVDFIINVDSPSAPVECSLVYLYFGGSILDTIPDLIIQGQENWDTLFGYRGAGIGDFNGDGGNDFMILDYEFWIDYEEDYRGRIYVYYGGEVLDNIPDWQLQGGGEFQRVGWDAAGLGDVNGDNFNDIVIVDRFCDGPQEEDDLGYLAIYHGGSIPDTLADVTIWGEEEDSKLGVSVTGVDFNRDGIKDVVVGNRRNYPPSIESSIYIFLSPVLSHSQPDYIFPGPGNYFNTIGDHLLGIDLNGDGWEDIVSGNSSNVLNAGKVYVCLNGANPDTLYDAIYYQGNTESNLGQGVCNIGDINGDDLEDLAIGEPGFNQFYTQNLWGRIHIILGDTSYHQSVGVEEIPQPPIPPSEIVLNTYPNPFNSQTVISFDLPVAGKVRLDVFDIAGCKINNRATHASPLQLSGSGTTPTTGYYHAGTHQITFDGEGLPSGVYIVRLKAGEYQAAEKVVLLR